MYCISQNENLKTIIIKNDLSIDLSLNMIYTNNYSGSYLIHIISHSGKSLNYIALTGNGPEEFQSPIQIIPMETSYILHNRLKYTTGKCVLFDYKM